MRELWDDRIIGPINRIKAFDISELELAMMYFSKGVHTGKIVITFENPKTELKVPNFSVPALALALC